jgi:hypothetical protein
MLFEPAPLRSGQGLATSSLSLAMFDLLQGGKCYNVVSPDLKVTPVLPASSLWAREGKWIMGQGRTLNVVVFGRLRALQLLLKNCKSER